MTERRRNRFTFAPKKVACSSPKGTTRYQTPSEAPYIKGWYTLGDKLQQHVATARRSDKSLRVCWRIFVKIFVSATEFCRSNTLQKIKSDRICATCTHGVICRRDVLLQLVAQCVPTLRHKTRSEVGEMERETRGGRWEGKRGSCLFPLPIVPRALAIFRSLLFFIGIPCGKLCGGERTYMNTLAYALKKRPIS